MVEVDTEDHRVDMMVGEEDTNKDMARTEEDGAEAEGEGGGELTDR